jgi:hypothetical protein
VVVCIQLVRGWCLKQDWTSDRHAQARTHSSHCVECLSKLQDGQYIVDPGSLINGCLRDESDICSFALPLVIYLAFSLGNYTQSFEEPHLPSAGIHGRACIQNRFLD